ncbi:alpha-N-acetylgalactosaminide alpha-2,6-sialyltransferase 5 isoform X1 [Myiozetetes cayanensis]|uniref:alpha-N-acetylgalactosaminide alpha-2,6-sialyltransferase 5 isoform X1 n=1 Tax=Myiozetetes cayanensis TaxID=478635 RepID=UPI00215F5C48|nr:alpha-N-acetylgalactosaminide alpha-2,6-sialyltransferase 5 isoform X1 [Myiozetetes cayanensis]
MPSLAGSGRTGGREAHKMKTLMRHGLAVCLALTTMCTSLLLMYGGIGGIGGGHPEPRRRQQQQQQQQVAAVPSRPPERGQRHPALPVGAGLLEGYISVLEHKPLKMHCRSCALVTSSGHLLGGRQGDRIDETECVIRMNDAPTRGYGRDVGNRTSLRVIAHSSIQRILRNRNELLNMSHGAVFIFWGPSSYMRRDGKGLVYNNLQLINQILPQLKAYMISRHKMLQFDDLFKRETGKDRKISNTWLSTGWFTMAIALELCDRINVYGMVPPDFCRDPNHLSVPYHYYEPLGPDECTMYLSHERGRKGSHHRFITEKRVFESWARTFDIRFFQPDWKPEPRPGNRPQAKPLV